MVRTFVLFRNFVGKAMEKLLKDILREQMQIKGLNPERIRQLTGITERFIAAFTEGTKEKLPAAPYVRGYLLRIAAVLDLSGQELWETYKSELLSKSSGPLDRLPENRFALKKINKKRLALGAAALLLIVYLAINANRFLGRPQITITSPAPETFVTTASTLNLAGQINPSDKLIIGGEEIQVDESGRFEESYELEPGLNRIEFLVKRFLGREARVIKQVIYQPSEN